MRWVVGDRAIDFDHLRDPWWSSASLVSVANSNLGISTRSPSSTSVGLITLGAAAGQTQQPPPQNTQDGRLFAKAVAMECAAGDGIRVNTVHPGVIDTPIWTKLPVSAGRNVPIDPNEVAKTGVPFGRAGQAQDIANGVLFLASVGEDNRKPKPFVWTRRSRPHHRKGQSKPSAGRAMHLRAASRRH